MTTKRNDRNIDAASLDLDAIKARAAAATEGPWEWDDPTISQHWSRPAPWATVVDDEVRCGDYCYGGSSDPIKSDADGAFIAHAREDIPALLDEVERLRAALTITDEMVERHRKATYSHTLSKGNANPAKTEACGCGYQNEATPEGWLDLYAHQSRAALAAALGGEQR